MDTSSWDANAILACFKSFNFDESARSSIITCSNLSTALSRRVEEAAAVLDSVTLVKASRCCVNCGRGSRGAIDAAIRFFCDGVRDEKARLSLFLWSLVVTDRVRSA